MVEPSSQSEIIDIASEFESVQQEIQDLCEYLHKFREGRRAIALAITKLEEARLWLGEAAKNEPRS